MRFNPYRRTFLSFALSIPFLTTCSSGLCPSQRACLPALVLSTGSSDFGSRAALSTTVQTLTVQNSGRGAARGLTGTLTSGFSFTGGTYPGTGGTCSSRLNLGGTCSLSITFTAPGVLASFPGALTLSYAGGSSTLPLVGATNENGSFRKGIFVSDAVFSLTPGPTATYASGLFSAVGATGATLLARVQSNFSLDSVFDTVNSSYNAVFDTALALDASGDLYSAGSFDTYKSNSNVGLVRINSDGSYDAGFPVGSPGFNSAVYTVAVATDGSNDVYAGGNFTFYQGVNRNFLVRLNSNATVDGGFAVGTNLGGAVTSLAVALDGSNDVYIGGQFTNYGATPLSRIARLNSNGTIDAGFNIGAGFDAEVVKVLPATDGSFDLYVGGSFTTYAAVSSNGIVRLNSDGSIDAGFAVGTGFTGGEVRGMALDPAGSGDLYVVGDFTSYQGNSANRIVRLNSDGSRDLGFDIGEGLNAAAWDVAFEPDGSGDILVGGYFTSYKGASNAYLTRINPLGTVPSTIVAQSGLNGPSYGAAALRDGTGDIIVGGTFTGFDGATANGIVRIKPDYTRDTTFQSGSAFDSGVLGVFVPPVRNDVYYTAGGSLNYNGTSISKLTRHFANGQLDPSLNTGTGFAGATGSVFWCAFPTDGSEDVYVAGDFTSYQGVSANYLMRINYDGSRDTGFAVGVGFNDYLESVQVLLDGSGKVYAAGKFTLYQGAPANRIVRLNSDGSVDASFVVGAGFDDEVWAVAEAQDGSGDIYVGGNFNTYQGTSTPRVVRLNADGSRDAAFNVGTGANDLVRTLYVPSDGSNSVFLGGDFFLYNGSFFNKVVKVGSTGAADVSFATGLGFYGRIDNIFPAQDGTTDLYFTGEFDSYNGQAQGRVARLKADGTLDW